MDDLEISVNSDKMGGTGEVYKFNPKICSHENEFIDIRASTKKLLFFLVADTEYIKSLYSPKR